MPCDSVITSNMKWAAATDPAILLKALQATGYDARLDGTIIYMTERSSGVSGTYDVITHVMRHTARRSSGFYQEGDEIKIKQAYSTEVVNSQAKKYGWQLEWKTNAAGNPVATVKRRA